MKLSYVLLGIIPLLACDDDPYLVNPESSAGNPGSVSNTFPDDYTDELNRQVRLTEVIVDDTNGQLQIWNATSNVEHATTEFSKLLTRANNVVIALGRLNPPSQYNTAHSTFRGAVQSLVSALSATLEYLRSDATDEDALLRANIEMVEYNKQKDRFNELLN
jgi:hypothetical protein